MLGKSRSRNGEHDCGEKYQRARVSKGGGSSAARIASV
jgi:hypothetical protein